jgi:hypothetical protein
VASVAGVPDPAGVGVLVVPGPASRLNSPAVAGISGPVLDRPCLEERGVLWGEGRWDELLGLGEYQYSLGAPECPHDWREDDKVLPPLWLVRRRDP